MQRVADSDKSPSAAGASIAKASAVNQSPSYPEYRTIRRNGALAGFDLGANSSETLKKPYGGVPIDENSKSAMPPARALTEKNLAYSHVTAHEQSFLLDDRYDRSEERAQLFRNPGHRVTDRRRTQWEMSGFIAPASNGGGYA